MSLKILAWPLSVIGWMYAPLLIPIANGGSASPETIITAWIIGAFLFISYAEMKFISQLGA